MIPAFEVGIAQGNKTRDSSHGCRHKTTDIQPVISCGSIEKDIQRPVFPSNRVIPTYCPFGTCLSFHDQIIGSRIRCQTTICFLIKIGAFIIESFPLINIERSHRITGLHNLQRTSQIAIVSSEYKVISCEVCYFILHIRSIQTGFPCHGALHRESSERHFDSCIVKFPLINPIGTTSVIFGYLFLKEQIFRLLLKPVHCYIKTSETQVQSQIILISLFPRNVRCSKLIPPISRRRSGSSPTVRGTRQHTQRTISSNILVSCNSETGT